MGKITSPMFQPQRNQSFNWHWKLTGLFFVFAFVFCLFAFSLTYIHDSQDSRRRGGYLFNSSLPLLPASQTLRHQPGNYCRELTSAHSQQLDSNREPLVSKRKSLTTKLRALARFYLMTASFLYGFPQNTFILAFYPF